jgi:CRP/FNR family transcriptional regulator, anaerobic regulatory protein
MLDSPLHRSEFSQALRRGDEKLAALMGDHLIALPSGSTLISAGAEHKFIYRLKQGWVGRSRLLPDGRNQIILVFLPGDLFAVKSLFMSQHPDAVEVISDARVERIGYQELYAAYTSDSDIASRCLWQIMEEERRLHNWVVSLGQGSAEERVATLLIDFRGRLVLSGTIAPNAREFEMPLTQLQLAEFLGVTSVHVNRVLKTLRDSGIVTIRDGIVLIENLQALAERAFALLDPFERSSSAYVGDRKNGA